jgi:hypothetical protein
MFPYSSSINFLRCLLNYYPGFHGKRTQNPCVSLSIWVKAEFSFLGSMVFSFLSQGSIEPRERSFSFPGLKKWANCSRYGYNVVAKRTNLILIIKKKTTSCGLERPFCLLDQVSNFTWSLDRKCAFPKPTRNNYSTCKHFGH